MIIGAIVLSMLVNGVSPLWVYATGNDVTTEFEGETGFQEEIKTEATTYVETEEATETDGESEAESESEADGVNDLVQEEHALPNLNIGSEKSIKNEEIGIAEDFQTNSMRAFSMATENEDIPDFDIWLARTGIYGIDNNGGGQYPLFESYQDPVYKELGGYLLDDTPLLAISTTWSMFFNSEYRNQFMNGQKYIYEVLLMDYLKYDAESDSLSTELINNKTDFSLKLYSAIAGDLKENTADYIKDMTVGEAVDFYEDVKTIDNLGIALKEVKDGVNSVKELIDVLSEYLALQQVKEERIYLLKEARDNCSDIHFVAAANDLINVLESSVLEYVQGKSLDYLWGQACDFAWEKLGDMNPVLKTIDLAVAGFDVCFDNTTSASNNLKLALLYTTDTYLRQGMRSAHGDFVGNNSKANAKNFNACFTAYLQFQMYGNDYSKTWLKDYLDSGIVSNFINMIFYRENIKTANELILRGDYQKQARKNILKIMELYADFYRDEYYGPVWQDAIFESTAVTGVEFLREEVTIAGVDGMMLAYADILPANATNKRITYVSSDPSILEVPQYGGFGTVKKEGVVTITATTEDGGFQATQTVIIGKNTGLSDVAGGKCGDNVWWKLFDDGTLYLYGDGEMYDYNKYINSYAPWHSSLDDREMIGKIIIDDGVTTIGGRAFINCPNLREVDIPDSVTTIEKSAFAQCTSLSEVNIPNSVIIIGTGAFAQCRNLREINIPNRLTIIEDSVFAYCDNLSKVNISGSVKAIGGRAFYYCFNLREINIPNSVTTIGDRAFYYCANLSEINIPNGVATIGDRAFYSCDNLSEINIPSSVTTIKEAAFSSCDNLRKVNIQDGVISIGDSTFVYCYNLSEINIPNSVTTIGDRAFLNCYSLSEVNIPSGLTIIGASTFYACFNLSEINIPNSVTTIGESAFNSSNLREINIPNSVTTIGDSAFLGSNLREINIPGSVTTIGDSAFSGCDNLRKVIIRDGVKTIGDGAFSGCDNLSEINISNSVTTIGDSAFTGSNLREINIPGSVTTIGERAFGWCDNLRKVIIRDGVTTIGEQAFYYCDNLSEVNIPNSVTTIGESAFGWCSYLSKGKVYFQGDAPTIQGDIFNFSDIDIYIYRNAKGFGTDYWNRFTKHFVDAVPTTTPRPTTTPTRPTTVPNKPTVTPNGPTLVKPTIKLNKSSATMYSSGTKKKLSLKANATGASKKVTWKSSNTKIATVNSKGVVTAKKAGKVTITATANGVSSKATITVKTFTLKLTKSKATIKKGGKVTIKVTATPKEKITYKTSNKKIATVTSKGVVKGIKKGTAKITVTANGIKRTFKVTVK